MLQVFSMLGDNLLVILCFFCCCTSSFYFLRLFLMNWGCYILGAVFVLIWLRTEENLRCLHLLSCPLGGVWDLRPRSRSGGG